MPETAADSLSNHQLHQICVAQHEEGAECAGLLHIDAVAERAGTSSAQRIAGDFTALNSRGTVAGHLAAQVSLATLQAQSRWGCRW